jgi:hypothetical protein
LRAVPFAVPACLVCLTTTATHASAQRLLDLQVRTSAGADALATGAAAVFWNPAATASVAGRGEALVVDVRGATATGLEGFALAAAGRPQARTVVAAGYQHVGVDGIERTSTSPLQDPEETEIDVGEHVFAAALARTLSVPLAVGAVVRYVRTADIAGGDGVVEFGAGVTYRPALPLAPVLGAAARVEEDGTNWTAGIELAPPIAAADWRVRASWGVGGSPQVEGVTHRFAALVDWRALVSVSAGVAAEPDGPGRSWQPLAAATLHVNRFAIGVLREELPNDFGAIHSLRFSVRVD